MYHLFSCFTWPGRKTLITPNTGHSQGHSWRAQLIVDGKVFELKMHNQQLGLHLSQSVTKYNLFSDVPLW